MKNGMITYGRLFNILRDLGFESRKVEEEGRSQLVFTHSGGAVILLPPKARSERVLPLHLAAVRTVLKSHGVLEAATF